MARSKVFSRLPVLLILFGLSSLPALAQQGRIVGTIFDSSGAVIPGVTVTAINNATNVKLEFVTDVTGNYDFPGLTVGSYTIRTSLAGFKTGEARVVVEVAQAVRQNLTLAVGDVQEVVTVQGERGPVLQTENAEVGQVVTNREIVELPLNGRDFFQLIMLSTGAVQFTNETTIVPNLASIDGGRPGTEQYLIDGVNAGVPGDGRLRHRPSIDSIQEFKLQGSTFAAEYGRGAGIVNLVTRSGGNEYHGSLFNFWRNDKLAANDFFLNQQQNPQKGRLNRNQFGAALGGRIVRDKTFFFTNYEGHRMAQARNQTFRAPTALERAGDFSQSPGVPYVLDPLTFRPFPNKVVPPARIHRTYKYFADWFPAPNDATGLFRVGTSTASIPRDQVSGRVDHHFSSSDKVYGRYFFANDEFNDPGFGSRPGLMGLINNNWENRNQQVVAHWDHIFSPRLVMDFQYSHVRYREVLRDHQTWFPEDKGAINHVVESGISGMEFNSKYFPGVPLMQFGNNFPSLGVNANSPIRQGFKTNAWKADLTWIKGRHTVKTGLDFLIQQHQAEAALGARGIFQFAGVTTNFQNAWADFVLGVPIVGVRLVPILRFGLTRDTYQFFVQDEVKISPRLTINVGLRYDYNVAPTPLWGQAGVDVNTGKVVFSDVDGTGKPNPTYAPGLPIMAPLLGDNLVSTTQVGLPPSFARTNRANFGPRVALAWRPWGTKTVVRAGYGIYYIVDPLAFVFISAAIQPPYGIQQLAPTNLLNASAGRPLVTIDQLFQPFEQTKSIAASEWGAFSINPSFPVAYENHYSLSIQREITSTLVLETSYVGKSSVHLAGTRFAPLPANRPSFVPPFTTFFTPEGTSSYQSLQVRAEKRSSHGLTFLTSYTWSKALDFGSQNFGGGIQLTGDFTNRRRGAASFDVPQRLAISVIYDLPFGKGRKWLRGAQGWVDGLLGGWQLSVIDQFQSGRPFGVNWLGGNTGDARNPIASIPDRVGGGKLDNPTPETWFDTSAFVAHRKPPDPSNPGTFLPQDGNAGRNILRTDGVSNWDIGIFKNFRLGPGERYRVQFRAEMFNASNHVTFDGPGTAQGVGGGSAALGTPGAAKVLRQYNSPRQIQFALKVSF